MYTFAITVLLGLALLKLLDVVEELAPTLARVRGGVTTVLAVGAAFVLDYSLFESFGADPREAWMGPLFTGLVIAGTTAVWAALLHWLGRPERHEPLLGRQPGNVVGKAA